MSGIRRRRVGVAVLASALGLVATGASPGLAASAAAGSVARSGHGADLAVVQAYVAGGARSAEQGDSLTFVFVAKNFGPANGDVSIDMVSLRGIRRDARTTSLSCVLPDGFVINPDGNSCEPGFASAGMRAGSLVLTGLVAGTSNVVVKVCTSDLDGTPDPDPANDCRTLRVTLV